MISQQINKHVVGSKTKQLQAVLMSTRKSSQLTSPLPFASSNCAPSVLYRNHQQRRYFSLHQNFLTKTAQFKLANITPKLAISYKCKVCGTQNVQSFSRKSYEKGIVIVQCEGCKNNHLIADNLGWFSHV